MKNINLLSYLYFLDKHNGVNNSFYNSLFHFNKYISLNTNLSWEKLFWFFEDSDHPKDVNFDQAIRTLFHHQYIDLKFNVTSKGRIFLSKNIQEFEDFKCALDDFNCIYKNETFKEKSCYIKNHSFPVSCHLCTNRVCQDASFNKEDLLALVNFKGFKNPHKKINIKNPYSVVSE